MAIVKITLPSFTGTGGAPEVQHFISLFSSYCTTMHLQDHEMDVFPHCMKINTKAAEWWSNVQNGNKPHNTWALTEQLLLERFNKKKNPGELAALVSTLQQRRDEGVDDYRDRVDTFSREIAREIPDAWTAAEKTTAKRTLQEVQAKIHFLVGLRPDLRKRVCAEDINTLDDYQAAARRAENALNDTKSSINPATGNKPVYVSSVEHTQDATPEQEIQEATEYIDYLRAGGPVKGRFQQRGPPQRPRGGGQSNYTPRRPVQRGDKRPSWISFVRLPPNTCYTCGNQGHIANDCKVPEKNYRWDLAVQQLVRNNNQRVNEIADANSHEEEEPPATFDSIEATLRKYAPDF